MKHRKEETMLMIPRCIRWLLMVGILVLGGILSLGRGDLQAAPPTGVFKAAIHWSISADHLDPATATFYTASMPLYLFHDALVKPMPEGNFTPGLAESWTISPDTKVYEFKLRRGVKFHNGDTMTADDVIFSFWRYKGGQAKAIQSKTEKVEAVNPYLVRFQFKEPFPDFLEQQQTGISSIGWVVPKKYVEKVGDAEFKRNPIGAGPYKFVEFVAGARLVGEAFEGYWRKVPHVKRIEIQIVSEPGTRLTMLKRGEVDLATLMQGVFYEDVKKDPKLRLLMVQSPTLWIVNFGSQWDPKSPWSDPRVRKAASLAIDRQTLADVHAPGCGPVGQLGLDTDPSALRLSPDPYDPEQAKKLLAEAGYPKGFNGGKFYPYEGGYWPYGEQVANYWKAIGISMETVLLDRPAIQASRASGKFKGSVFIETIFHSTIGLRMSYLLDWNILGSYPDIQALWDQYKRETSAKVRKDLIGNIQKMIHERSMFIPLTSTNSPAAVGPRVKGTPYKVQPFLWFPAPFEDIELNS